MLYWLIWFIKYTPMQIILTPIHYLLIYISINYGLHYTLVPYLFLIEDLKLKTGLALIIYALRLKMYTKTINLIKFIKLNLYFY